MLRESMQAELQRLQIHPVNLDAVSEADGVVLLRGSLMSGWQVPKSIDGAWLLTVLKGLPDLTGPEATMNAYYAAYLADGFAQTGVVPRPATT